MKEEKKYDREKLLSEIRHLQLYIYYNNEELKPVLENASTMLGKLDELEYYLTVERKEDFV